MLIKKCHTIHENITHIIQQFQSRFGWGKCRQFPPEFWRGGGNLGGRIGRCSGEYRITFSKTINSLTLKLFTKMLFEENLINLKIIHKNAIWRELLARTIYIHWKLQDDVCFNLKMRLLACICLELTLASSLLI